jgi:excisionase family DNA binding protein
MATAEVALPTTLTVEQAARVASISRRHAYHLVNTGEIPSVRLGGAIRIPTRRLLAMLEGASPDGTEELNQERGRGGG